MVKHAGNPVPELCVGIPRKPSRMTMSRRHRFRSLVLGATALLFCLPPALAQETTSAITAADLSAHVKVLASDEFEGRKPGTPGEVKTIAYLEQQLKRLGIAPGMPDGSYRQTVPMLETTSEVVGPAIVRGKGGERSWSSAEQAVLWSHKPQRSLTVKDSEIVFLGYGVVAEQWNWNDYADVDVRGKTVIVLINDPGFDVGDETIFNGKAMTYYGRWPYKYSEGALQGAAAVLIVHETRAAAYPWSVVANGNRQAKLSLVRPDKGAGLSTVEGWIQTDVARDLFALAGQDFDALKLAANKRGFKPVPLGLTFSATLKNDIRQVQSTNIVGILHGAQRPEETILYTAHWDHLGKRPSVTPGDTIFNGALDNATGTAGLLEMAEAFASGPRPARSVVFIAFTAEEQGLWGSEYYATHPVYRLNKTVAGYNMDGLTVHGPMRDVVVTGAGKSELEQGLARWALANGRVVNPESFPERGSYYRSDHFPLAKVGVPMLYASSGHDSIAHGLEWGKAQANKYTLERYHTVKDEWSPDMDLSGGAQDVQMLFDLGAELARGGQWPAWYKDAEFRPMREKSLATP
jgi:Zn-dependent M28 family amino/carboxypeptidase